MSSGSLSACEGAAARDPRAFDSIQTVYTPMLDSIPGSLAQGPRVREPLMQLREDLGGADDPRRSRDQGRWPRAGPKTLEHLVDVVLQLEATAGRTGSCARAQESVRVDAGDRACSRCAAPGWPRSPIRRAPARRAPDRRAGSVVVASADGARPAARRESRRWSRRQCRLGGGPRRACDSNRIASAPRRARAARPTATSSIATCSSTSRVGLRAQRRPQSILRAAIDRRVACASRRARGRAIDAKTVVFAEVGLAVRDPPRGYWRAAAAEGVGASGSRRALCSESRTGPGLEDTFREWSCADRSPGIGASISCTRRVQLTKRQREPGLDRGARSRHRRRSGRRCRGRCRSPSTSAG